VERLNSPRPGRVPVLAEECRPTPRVGRVRQDPNHELVEFPASVGHPKRHGLPHRARPGRSRDRDVGGVSHPRPGAAARIQPRRRVLALSLPGLPGDGILPPWVLLRVHPGRLRRGFGLQGDEPFSRRPGRRARPRGTRQGAPPSHCPRIQCAAPNPSRREVAGQTGLRRRARRRLCIESVSGGHRAPRGARAVPSPERAARRRQPSRSPMG